MQIERLVNRFRVISMERLARLESCWAKAVDDPSDADAIATVYRELHTLKGDARMLRLSDVDLACHKLEDMLEVARLKHYDVSDEFEIVMMMAVQLVGVLINKRADQMTKGPDLPGFIQQMDAIIADSHLAQTPRLRVPTGKMPRIEMPGITALDSVQASALDTFLADERGWQVLRDLLALPVQIPIAPLFHKYESGAVELAADLGKVVAIRFEIDHDLVVDPEIYATLEVATIHLLRNALDHGSESDASAPAIIVRCHAQADQIVLTVADNGPGIDFERVRQRGIELGFLPLNGHATEAHLVKLLFQPRFSTRTVATKVSGRGIGLDAVEAAIRKPGGKIAVDSVAGRGVTLTVTLPTVARAVDGVTFTTASSTMKLAVTSDWTVDIVAVADDVIDLATLLGAARPAPPTTKRTTMLRLQRGDVVVHVAATGRPTPCIVRRIIVMPPEAPAEIVAIDGIEGLALRPERLRIIAR